MASDRYCSVYPYLERGMDTGGLRARGGEDNIEEEY